MKWKGPFSQRAGRKVGVRTVQSQMMMMMMAVVAVVAMMVVVVVGI